MDAVILFICKAITPTQAKSGLNERSILGRPLGIGLWSASSKLINTFAVSKSAVMAVTVAALRPVVWLIFVRDICPLVRRAARTVERFCRLIVSGRTIDVINLYLIFCSSNVLTVRLIKFLEFKLTHQFSPVTIYFEARIK